MSSAPKVQIKHALQEWQAVCQSLAAGACSVLLRKGGIHDRGGLFRPEHERFALMPTYLHQQANRLRQPTLIQDAPTTENHQLSHWAAVSAVWRCEDLDRLLACAGHWPWTDAEIEQRFHYRAKPYLFVLLLRVYAFAETHAVADDPSFAGCKSWLPLPRALDVDQQTAVLSDADWRQQNQDLHQYCR